MFKIILVSYLAVSFSLNFEKNLKSFPVQVLVVSGHTVHFEIKKLLKNSSWEFLMYFTY